MTSPSLAELNALTAVAARRSFRAAAADLNLSPSSLSHAVASIERRLGVRLFNRTTRSVALTEAGQQFLARVQPALSEIAEAMEGVNRFRDTPAGLLRFNASDGGAERILPHVMSFMAAYPDMRVEMVAEGRMVDIVAEGFDAGVRGHGAVPQDMVALTFGPQERYAVCASPAYIAARGAPVTPGDLLRHDGLRVRMPSGAILPWEFDRRGETVRIDPPCRLVLNSLALSIEAAKAGGGVIYAIERSVADDLAAGRLVRMLDDWTQPFGGVALYYPRQRLPSAGMRAFIDHFQAQRRR